MSEIERLAAALREARALRLAREEAVEAAQALASQARFEEMGARAALDSAVAALVAG